MRMQRWCRCADGCRRTVSEEIYSFQQRVILDTRGFENIPHLQYPIQLKPLCVTGDELVGDALAQAFKGSDVVFAVDVSIDAVADVVVVHEVGETGVLCAGEEGRVVQGGDDSTGGVLLCCLQRQLQADGFAAIDFSVFVAEIFC